MNPVTFETQLMVLGHRAELARRENKTSEVNLLMSLAESVKQARDHRLNCVQGQKGADQK